MPEPRVDVSVDFDANAAYLRLTDAQVSSTRELSEDVLVDLDAFGLVIGVELLRLDAAIPFQRLIDDFHVHSDNVEKLRAIGPSLLGRIQGASEGVTSTQANIPQLQ